MSIDTVLAQTPDAVFEEHETGTEYDRAARAPVMTCSSPFPGPLRRRTGASVCVEGRGPPSSRGQKTEWNRPLISMFTSFRCLP